MAPPKTPTKQPNPNALRLSAVGRAVQPKRAAPSGSTGLSPQEKRASRGGDVPEHVKRSAVAEYRVALAGASRLPAGALGRVLNKFRDYNVSRTSLLRWVSDHRKSLEASGPVEADAALKSKRAGRAATNTKLTVPVAQSIVSINAKHWGSLSNKRLAAKVLEKHPELGTLDPSTMRRWCKMLGAVKRRRYIKPKLTKKHRFERLRWILDSELEHGDQGPMLPDNRHTVHGDEKWFVLMHDGSVCRCFPDADGVVTMPAAPKVAHKSRMPKLMFLAATARPRPEYGFDGKIGLWFFGITRKAKKSHASTGTIKGVTDILETVTVDAKEYRKKVLGRVLIWNSICNRISRESRKLHQG